MTRWLVPGLLVVAVALAFSPAFGAEFVNWDDDAVLYENPHVHGLSAENLAWAWTFHIGHWHPLTWMSYMVEYELFGLEPGPYHVTNVALHALGAVLVWILAGRLARRCGWCRGSEEPFAAFAALLFALHPLRVESVAWVTERRDVLSGVFLIGTLIAWLAAVRPPDRRVGPAERQAVRHGGAYALAVVLFALSLLSKGWGLTLPAVLLVLDVWPLGRLRELGWGRLLVEKIPFALLAAAGGTLAYLAQRETGATAVVELAAPQKLAQVCYGLAFYVVTSLAPLRLNPIHLLDPDLDPTAPVYLAAIVGVAAAALVLALLRRRAPGVGVAFLVYAILVSPVLGLTQSGIQEVADRYSYLSTIPLAMLAAAGIVRVCRSRATLLLPGLVVLLLAAGTWRQAHVWRDRMALWNHILELEPDHWFALNSRGSVYSARGEWVHARVDLDAALRVHPTGTYAELAYDNRGRLRTLEGDLDGALRDFDRALALEPDLVSARNNRGVARGMAGDLEGAIADWTAALEIEPRNPEARRNRGVARVELGRGAEAVVDLEPLARGGAPEVSYHLARAYALEGRNAEARRACRAALDAAGPDWSGHAKAQALLDSLP